MSADAVFSEKKPVLGMIIDSSRCIDCKACLVSCKIANNVPEGQWRNWIKSDPGDEQATYKGQVFIRAHYQPGGCMHCSEAPCLAACPTGATYRNEADGVIMVDKGLCIGCGNCIPACPYGARFRHAGNNRVDKCDFCAERRERGLLPACVDTCITKARTFGLLDEALQGAEKRQAREGAPGIDRLVRIEPLPLKTEPSLRYINNTAPKDWPVQPETPLPMRIMTGSPGKGLFGLAGLSFLGVALMCLTQFREGRMEKRRAHDKAQKPPQGASTREEEKHG